MTKEQIKKELNKMIKTNGWNKCYGDFGIGVTMGKKQMEKNIALVVIGYVADDRYNAKATADRFTTSEEFKSCMNQINGTWHEEIRKVYGSEALYIVINY